MIVRPHRAFRNDLDPPFERSAVQPNKEMTLMWCERMARGRWLKLASMATMGALLQVGGCNLSLDTLLPKFVSSFVSLGLTSFVNSVFGVGF